MDKKARFFLFLIFMIFLRFCLAACGDFGGFEVLVEPGNGNIDFYDWESDPYAGSRNEQEVCDEWYEESDYDSFQDVYQEPDYDSYTDVYQESDYGSFRNVYQDPAYGFYYDDYGMASETTVNNEEAALPAAGGTDPSAYETPFHDHAPSQTENRDWAFEGGFTSEVQTYTHSQVDFSHEEAMPAAGMTPILTTVPTLSPMPSIANPTRIPTTIPAMTSKPTQIPARILNPTGIPSVTPISTQVPARMPEPTKIPSVTPTPTQIPSRMPKPTRSPAAAPEQTGIPSARNTGHGALAADASAGNDAADLQTAGSIDIGFQFQEDGILVEGESWSGILSLRKNGEEIPWHWEDDKVKPETSLDKGDQISLIAVADGKGIVKREWVII